MKSKFSIVSNAIFAAILLVGASACSITQQQDVDPLLGGWIASAQQEGGIPEGGSVTLLLGPDNSYVERTRMPDGQISERQGKFERGEDYISFGGNAKYRVALDDEKNSLVFHSLTNKDLIIHFDRASLQVVPAKKQSEKK